MSRTGDAVHASPETRRPPLSPIPGARSTPAAPQCGAALQGPSEALKKDIKGRLQDKVMFDAVQEKVFHQSAERVLDL